MFEPDRRHQIRQQVLDLARDDPTIVAAAVTGSQARGSADRWSDIDLFLAYGSGTTAVEVADSWTHTLDDHFGIAHYFDLYGNGALYRAFLLTEVVEVDIGFTDETHFRAVREQAFEVVFGRSASGTVSVTDTPPVARDKDRSLLGHAWHHLIHARVSVERDRLPQAVHWTNALREVLTTRAGRRRDLPLGADASTDRESEEIRILFRARTPATAGRKHISGDLDRLGDLLLAQAGETAGGGGESLARVVAKLRDFAWT